MIIKETRMESTFKEPVQKCHQGQNKVDMESDQASSQKNTSSTAALSQLELIAQWRHNLEQLLKDLGYSSSDNNLVGEFSDLTLDIKEKLDYVNKTDVLLKDNDDFALSDTGFEKYKSANLAIVRYLTQLQQEKMSKESGDKAVKFYFFSRAKHIKQQVNTIPWLFAFFHLIILVISTLALVLGGLIIAGLSQMNGIVLILLAAIIFTIFGLVKGKMRYFKNTALTPIRFLISFLSICSITTVLYAAILIAIPAFIAWEFKQFWRDDVLIIGLGVFTFILLGHSSELEEENAPEPSVEAEKSCLD